MPVLVALVRAGTGTPVAENAASPLEEPRRHVQQASDPASTAVEETREPGGIASGAHPPALAEQERPVVLGERPGLAGRATAIRR